MGMLGRNKHAKTKGVTSLSIEVIKIVSASVVVAVSVLAICLTKANYRISLSIKPFRVQIKKEVVK